VEAPGAASPEAAQPEAEGGGGGGLPCVGSLLLPQVLVGLALQLRRR